VRSIISFRSPLQYVCIYVALPPSLLSSSLVLRLELVQIHLELLEGLVQPVLLHRPPSLGRQTKSDKLAPLRPPHPLLVQIHTLALLGADVREGDKAALSVGALAQEFALALAHDGDGLTGGGGGGGEAGEGVLWLVGGRGEGGRKGKRDEKKCKRKK